MEDNKISNTTKFSLIKRAKSFAHAGRGLWMYVKTTHNAWIHISATLIAIFLGFAFEITSIEWALLTLAAGFVLSAEAFNTAIEIDMNLTSPQYHPYARDTKDVAAGAVLIASISALIIGIVIFGKYLIDLL